MGGIGMMGEGADTGGVLGDEVIKSSAEADGAEVEARVGVVGKSRVSIAWEDEQEGTTGLP
jgi:hypothetical protein